MEKMKIYIEKARKMPLKLLMKKIYEKTRDKIAFFIRKNIIARRPIDMKNSIFEAFEPKIKFLFCVEKQEAYVLEIEEQGKKDQILVQADRICSRIFNLLGSGDLNLGESIKWNQDFKTGFIWENDFYKEIRIVDLNNSADVKVPWEISRFQHIPTLGKASWITGEAKYAMEFKNEIEDWINKNPIEMSVNWSCTMDVAIRACNWIVGYFFFCNNPGIDQAFWKKFHKNLYLHGRFIIENLEDKDAVTNNHYLSNVVGLVWLGLYFKGIEENREETVSDHERWLECGLKALEKEMEIQVNNDGTDFEASTSYHCLVTEFFLHTTILCDKNGISFSKKYMDKLEKMCEFIMDITKPNNLIPLIGDMDSGRFIILSNYGDSDKRDFSHIVGLAGEFFDRGDFKGFAPLAGEEILWCFEHYKEYNRKMPELKSRSYEEGGYHILRNKNMHMLVRCGENGTNGEGGHTHNDQLSFELNAIGQDFVVDPGMYVYTADYIKRNLFRSTAYHNTLQIVGLEQNCFGERDLFAMDDETDAKLEAIKEGYLKGHHYGYLKKAGVIHKREFKLESHRVLITDNIERESGEDTGVDASSYLHLDKEVQAVQEGSSFLLKKNGVQLKIFNEDAKGCRIEDCFVSTEYGVLEKSKKIIFEIDSKKSVTFIEILNLED